MKKKKKLFFVLADVSKMDLIKTVGKDTLIQLQFR
jgi:hypothetical protein